MYIGYMKTRFPSADMPTIIVLHQCRYNRQRRDNTSSEWLSPHTGIYHHLYGAGATDTDVLLKASNEVQEFTESETFTATMVLVVTWDRVRQGRYRLVDFNPNQVSET